MNENIFKHLKTVFTHKKYVFEACYKLGIPIQESFNIKREDEK